MVILVESVGVIIDVLPRVTVHCRGWRVEIERKPQRQRQPRSQPDCREGILRLWLNMLLYCNRSRWSAEWLRQGSSGSRQPLKVSRGSYRVTSSNDIQLQRLSRGWMEDKGVEKEVEVVVREQRVWKEGIVAEWRNRARGQVEGYTGSTRFQIISRDRGYTCRLEARVIVSRLQVNKQVTEVQTLELEDQAKEQTGRPEKNWLSCSWKMLFYR